MILLMKMATTTCNVLWPIRLLTMIDKDPIDTVDYREQMKLQLKARSLKRKGSAMRSDVKPDCGMII